MPGVLGPECARVLRGARHRGATFTGGVAAQPAPSHLRRSSGPLSRMGQLEAAEVTVAGDGGRLAHARDGASRFDVEASQA